MTETNFYTPEEVRPYYDQIVGAYQSAFAGDPWYEVSKCADVSRRCVGGLSALAVGSMCQMCDASTTTPAYECQELIDRFEALAASRPTQWYLEFVEEDLALAAIAWKAPASTISTEKYADVPAMSAWLPEQLGEEPITWLDDIFADARVRPDGNLARFTDINTGFMSRLDSNRLAFRTLNPRMLKATKRLGSQAVETQAPDRRSFVIINAKTPGESQ